MAGLFLLVLLSLFPTEMPRVFAQEVNQSSLPDLGEPTAQTASVTPNINEQGAGLSYHDNINGTLLSISPQYNRQNGAALGGSVATPLGRNMAGGILLMAGEDRNEWLINLGLDLSPQQRFTFSLGQLRQKLDFNFTSGTHNTQITQDNLAVSYQYLLGQGWLNSAELNAYVSDTDSIDLSDASYTTDTASLYELWNDPRRIAGGKITGAQGRLLFTPTSQTTIKLGLGAERLTYDYSTHNDSTTRATGSAELFQRLDHTLNLRAALHSAAAQNRYSLALSKSLNDSAQLGLDLTHIQGRDNTFNDNQLQLTYSQSLGGNTPQTALSHTTDTEPNTTATPTPTPQPWTSALVEQVARRPSFLPAQVVAKVDTTATPTRLIAIDKTTLPADYSIHTSPGLLTVPTGTAVSSIAGVTLNGSAFTNNGHFALSGTTHLVINPNLMAQPSTTDTYIVTMNNSVGGGTTLATVTVSHGSTRIDSVVISSGQVAPTISGFNAISKTYGDADFTLTAPTTNSAGAFSYTSSNTGVAIISGTTVTIVGAGSSTITATQAANGAYSSGTATATLTVALPSGYITSGGLTWAPITTTANWSTADATCSASTALGYTDWRQPTKAELSALYAARNSVTPAGWPPTGWTLSWTWSSTAYGGGFHYNVNLSNGNVYDYYDSLYSYVSCVR